LVTRSARVGNVSPLRSTGRHRTFGSGYRSPLLPRPIRLDRDGAGERGAGRLAGLIGPAAVAGARRGRCRVVVGDVLQEAGDVSQMLGDAVRAPPTPPVRAH